MVCEIHTTSLMEICIADRQRWVARQQGVGGMTKHDVLFNSSRNEMTQALNLKSDGRKDRWMDDRFSDVVQWFSD